MDIANKNKSLHRSLCASDLPEINGHTLSYVDTNRDLGVLVDSNLKFTNHIANVVCTAKQRMALLFRAFITRDTKVLVTAYKTYILPLLDYCSPVWSPQGVHEVLLLEGVQRKFTKRLPICEGMNYWSRLKLLKMTTLERRRLNADLTFCYKIINGLIGGGPESCGLVVSARQSRGNPIKLVINNPKINTRKHSFSHRVCAPWNSLPEEVVRAGSVKAFAKKLLSLELQEFLLVDESRV